MMVSKYDDWFDITPRTEYENKVQQHYEWMRSVMWDETPQTNSDNFFFVNSPPPSYEEAAAAAAELLLQKAETEEVDDDAATTTAVFEQRDSKQVMRNIIMKYLEHHRLK